MRLDQVVWARYPRGMGIEERMPRRLLQAMTLLTAALLVVAVVQPEPMTMVIAAIAALAVATTVGSRYLAVLISVHLLGVGDRAREHTRGLDEVPAPRHPNTRGRRRPRAPSPSAAVA